MTRSETDLLVQQRFRTLVILCAAIALSLVMVNAALAILQDSASPAAPLSRDVTLSIFVVALLLLAAAPAAKRTVFKRAGAEEGFEHDPARRVSFYAKGTILGFAMREAAGLIGFVLALFTGNPWWSWILGGTAVIAMYADRPRREDLGL